ncbi:DUF4359 domain-containing protein [Gloeomargarita lithophora]|uniref:DUF4359 domain-containing protein n=1 Tax=Gloeomargarita lithophora TaxID=1188228 RepID=UPI0012FE41C0|nr:DUF4359 domain-containing protein [Gloeomargarita lithophora]
MKRPIVLGILGVGAAVGLGLGLTNPSEQEFIGFAFVTLRQELCPRLPDILKEATESQEIPQFLTTYLNQSCSDILTAIRGTTEDFLRRNTRVQNYVLFSLYTTDLFGSKYRTIGIARQFITIPEK